MLCFNAKLKIPFDQILDCYIVQPAGSYYFFVPKTLTEAYLGRSPRFDSQISFSGLKRPADFRSLVLESKKMKLKNTLAIDPLREQESSCSGVQSECVPAKIDITATTDLFQGNEMNVCNDHRETELSMSEPAGTASSFSALIPEARNLTWTDDFFDDEADNIVAVFDFNYDFLQEWMTYRRTLVLSSLAFLLLFLNVTVWLLIMFRMPAGIQILLVCSILPSSLCFTLLILAISVTDVESLFSFNVSWFVKCLHVAVTSEGICFVRDQRRAGFGWTCMDRCQSRILVRSE